MKILENDHSFITVQNLDPKWNLAQVHQAHQDRIAEALRVAALWDGPDADWYDVTLNPATSNETGAYRRLRPEVTFLMVKLPPEVRDRIGRELAGDLREAAGKNRSDARVEIRSTRRRSYEEWADEFGIPTNDTNPGWKAQVVNAVADAPTRGRVGE